jgi:hypothetical protein
MKQKSPSQSAEGATHTSLAHRARETTLSPDIVPRTKDPFSVPVEAGFYYAGQPGPKVLCR